MYDIDHDGHEDYSVWYVPSDDLDAPRLLMREGFKTHAAARAFINDLEANS